LKETDTSGNEVMSYKGLSAYLKLSQDTLRHKVMRGKIPFFRIDGAVRFSKKKIDEWIEEQHDADKQINTENHEGYNEKL